MKLFEQLATLDRLDKLIQRKGTGTAEELAERLNVCRRSVFNYLDKLRDYDAEIAFCPERKSFYYVDDKTPNLPIITKQNLRKLNGGESFLFNFERVQNFCTPTYDLCSRLNNNGQQNDAGGFGCVALEY